jgi:hypothetical protein
MLHVDDRVQAGGLQDVDRIRGVGDQIHDAAAELLHILAQQVTRDPAGLRQDHEAIDEIAEVRRAEQARSRLGDRMSHPSQHRIDRDERDLAA